MDELNGYTPTKSYKTKQFDSLYRLMVKEVNLLNDGDLTKFEKDSIVNSDVTSSKFFLFLDMDTGKIRYKKITSFVEVISFFQQQKSSKNL